MNSIANRVKRLRKDANMSQEELAQKVGVSDGAISNWESGVTSPRFSTWNRFKAFEEQYWNERTQEPKVVDKSLPFGQRVENIRRILGMSQEVFAKKFDVSSGAISNWEIGRNEPMGKYYKRLDEIENEVLAEHNLVEVHVEAAPAPVTGTVQDFPVDDIPVMEDIVPLTDEDVRFFEEAIARREEKEEEEHPADSFLIDLESKTTPDTPDFERALREYGPVAGLIKLDEHMRKLKQLNKQRHKNENAVMKEALHMLMADAWRTIKTLNEEGESE